MSSFSLPSFLSLPSCSSQLRLDQIFLKATGDTRHLVLPSQMQEQLPVVPALSTCSQTGHCWIVLRRVGACVRRNTHNFVTSDRDALNVSLSRKIVEYTVLRARVVPYCNCPRRPVVPDVEPWILDMPSQKRQQSIALSCLELDDATGEVFRDVQALSSRVGMNADHRMNCRDVRLVVWRSIVQSSQIVQHILHWF